jgi:hypothetical protein
VSSPEQDDDEGSTLPRFLRRLRGEGARLLTVTSETARLAARGKAERERGERDKREAEQRDRERRERSTAEIKAAIRLTGAWFPGDRYW